MIIYMNGELMNNAKYVNAINSVMLKAERITNEHVGDEDTNLYEWCYVFHDVMNYLTAMEGTRFIGGYTRENITTFEKPKSFSRND